MVPGMLNDPIRRPLVLFIGFNLLLCLAIVLVKVLILLIQLVFYFS